MRLIIPECEGCLLVLKVCKARPKIRIAGYAAETASLKLARSSDGPNALMGGLYVLFNFTSKGQRRPSAKATKEIRPKRFRWQFSQQLLPKNLAHRES